MLSESMVAKIQELKKAGWGKKAIARELDCSVNTVRRYWEADPKNLSPQTRRNHSKLDAYEERLEALYDQHKNCDVVMRSMKKQYGIECTRRLIELHLKPYRLQKEAERLDAARALRRIETPRGEFLQIDFGQKFVSIGGKYQKIHLFVATLAYSRRVFVKVTDDERQETWLAAIEDAFIHFGGLPYQIVSDNASSLVREAAGRGFRECKFTDRYLAFCRYWDVSARACYPQYPQSKGKVENMVKYVKNNGLAGYKFSTFEEVQKHLEEWEIEVADMRNLDLAGGEESIPARRFEAERKVLRPICKPPFLSAREMIRTPDKYGQITYDRKHYQISCRYSRKPIRVVDDGTYLTMYLGRELVARRHKEQDQIRTEYLDVDQCQNFGATDPAAPQRAAAAEEHKFGQAWRDDKLNRNLSVYEDITGRWQ